MGTFRARVNEGVLGAAQRAEATADLKAFAAGLGRLRPRRETAKESEDALDRTMFGVFNTVFEEEEKSVSGRGEEEARKRIDLLEWQLSNAREVMAEMKKSDAELSSVNLKLQAQVEALSEENRKLVKLATFLRHFERENKELRFLFGDLLQPGVAAPR